jgi:hypothetical protein
LGVENPVFGGRQRLFDADIIEGWRFEVRHHPDSDSISLYLWDKNLETYTEKVEIDTHYKTTKNERGEKLSFEEIRGWTEVTEQVLKSQS